MQIVLVGLIRYINRRRFYYGILVLFAIVFGLFACNNPQIINREYYESGAIKAEEFANKDNKVFLRKEYYENGKILAEASFTDGLLDGILTKYYSNGKVEFEKEFDMGKEVSYVSYDSLGNKDYWKRNLSEEDIPAFKDEFIQVVSYSDSGLVVNLSVPDISPFQILPIMKRASAKSIDIKKGDWLILPKQDSIEVGIGIEMTDSTYSFMELKQFIISGLQ